MKKIMLIRQRRHSITVILACIALGLEIYYSICAGSCSYLRGSIFGIDLQYAGIAYMVFIILLGVLKKDILLFFIVSVGVGIEFYLIGFQVWYDTYCPYCLAFGGIIFLLYIVNFIKDRLFYSLFYMAMGLVVFALVFKGSVAPTYTYTFLRRK
ncbi:MAG: hypothetical protein PHT96_00825 [Syntrophorhabdaceae bacterium]|nr:hypothetical protein [Syntrophorhabdaceae bacterium]MDD4194938.1 hypothetical protein [Syntrophorhabdaceae bacterium]